MARTKGGRRKRVGLGVDHAIIAVLIAAMDANQHVSPEEAARAHHLIWSMRRFRRRSGEAVNRMIADVRTEFEKEGDAAVLARAARLIPARLRLPAFAVAVDVMLADVRLERAERAFVRRLAAVLHVDQAVADDIVKVIRIKNYA